MVIDFMEHPKKPRGKITMMNILKQNSSIRRKLIQNKFFENKIDATISNQETEKEIELFKILESSIRKYFDEGIDI